jgi:riboflavin biosynthesis pyrimidine reductase
MDAALTTEVGHLSSAVRSEQRQRVGARAVLAGWLQSLTAEAQGAESNPREPAHPMRSPGREGPAAFRPRELVAELRQHRLEQDGRRCPYVMAILALAGDGRPEADPHAAGAFEPGATVEDVARGEIDAILIGAGALRSGRYERGLARPELRAHRRGRGLMRDPLGIVIARSGELPHDLSIAVGAESPLVLYTTVSDSPITGPAGVEVVRLPPRDLTPTAVLVHARRERGVRTVLYEGGSSMLAALLGSGCLDDLYVTIDDRLAADPAQAPASDLPGFDRLMLEHAWQDETGRSTLVRLRASG